MKMYGIKNCDTIKKAKKWLDESGIEFDFHDYKKDGLSRTQLNVFVQALGWEALVNKRGTTYRKLEEDVKENMDQASAIDVMLENPSIIKRPLLEIKSNNDKRYLLGFKAEQYQDLI